MSFKVAANWKLTLAISAAVSVISAALLGKFSGGIPIAYLLGSTLGCWAIADAISRRKAKS